MRDLLITLIVFGSVPFILMRPSIGVLMWSWLGYMNPHRLTWGFAYNFPFSQIVAASLILGLFFSKEPKKIPFNALTTLWLIWVLWMCMTTFMAIDSSHSAWELERTLKIQMMVLATIMVMKTHARINNLVWVIVVSIGFYGVKGGLFTLVTGGNYLVWGPPMTHITGNNEIAFALVMTLPLMRYLQLETQHRWVRMGLIVSMLLVSVSIIGSYSRGAFLAGSAMALSLILKSKNKFRIGVVLVVLGIIAAAFIPQKWEERMATIQNYEMDASAMGRINAWRFAINLAKEYPVFGGGFDTFLPELFQTYAPVPDDFHDAHSIYFEVLAEHGFVGLAIYLLLGLVTLQNGRKIAKLSKNRESLRWIHNLSSMIQVSIIGYAVGGAFLGLAYFDLYYHLIAIVILMRFRAEQEVAREPEPGARVNIAADESIPQEGGVFAQDEKRSLP
ncbi:MAG TPA: putative O-glycosylation ligase, exosortase A system-associated [Woeseiaceae bacterium]|nr:putative O-glycosylation ligase, exosortase A system-associated [Woeseiaceae bacterium]